MTANQIAWAKHLEDVRTHMTQEGETARHNLATEGIQKEGNLLNYETSLRATEASLRNAELNAATSRENALLNADTELTKAQINAATSRYATDVNAQTSIHVAGIQSDTSKYATDTQASTSRYATEVQHGTAISQVHQRGKELEETIRHNKMTEAQGWVKQAVDVGKAMAGVIGTLLPLGI